MLAILPSRQLQKIKTTGESLTAITEKSPLKGAPLPHDISLDKSDYARYAINITGILGGIGGTAYMSVHERTFYFSPLILTAFSIANISIQLIRMKKNILPRSILQVGSVGNLTGLACGIFWGLSAMFAHDMKNIPWSPIFLASVCAINFATYSFMLCSDPKYAKGSINLRPITPE